MKIFPTASQLTLVVALALTAAACGSSAPATVTVTKPVPASTSSSTTSAKPATSTSASSTSTTPSSSTSTSTTSTASAEPSTSTTRTETAPAFVQSTPSGTGALGHDLSAAIAVLAASSYTPVSTATYDAGNTLRVLIGRRAGGTGERAFFFDQTIYLGTDADTPSQQISLVRANDTEVTLDYGIYRSGAAEPSGQRAVRFALDMGQLSALDLLPSVAERR
jgi:LppP/LprE lipoprotein